MPAIPEAPYVGLVTDRYKFGRFYYANGAAAGVFTLDLTVPAYCLLLDVGVTSLALWNQGTSAALVAGDADDADGFLASIDCTATDLLKYESISLRAGTALAGGKIGAYIANSQWCKGSGTYGQLSPVARTISFVLTTVGTDATTGELIAWIAYTPPVWGGAEPLLTPSYVAS